MSENRKRLFIIDGTYLIFRSFHAFSTGTQLTSKGRNVGMIYGFLSSLLSLCKQERPDQLIIAFDTGAPTFRHVKFPEYKANRPPMDEGLRVQIPVLYDVITALKIPQMSMDGWEADDLIGTMSRIGTEKDLSVFLVTGDKDYFQLVNDNVRVYNPGKRQEPPIVYDAQGVKEKFGVLPEQVIDVLGLMGDNVDNVPGVPGVGPKTAVTLVNDYGDMESVLSAAQGMKPGKLRENLIQFAEQARLSKDLVIIDTHAPLEVDLPSIHYGPLNNLEARRKLIDLEFKNILNTLDQLEPADLSEQVELIPEETVKVHRDYFSVTNPSQLQSMISELQKAPLISMDLESTSIDSMIAEIVGLSFSIKDNHGWYVAANFFTDVPDHYKQPTPPKLRPNISRETAFILDQIKLIYTSDDLKKTGQNLKYDMLVLACYDIEVKGVEFDTLLASHLLDPSGREHNIDALTVKYLNLPKIPTSQLIGSGAKQTSMLDVTLEQITEYACEDTDMALRLTNYFRPQIENTKLDRILYNQEVPLIPVLTRMEKTGVKLDVALLKEMSGQFQEEMEVLVGEVQDLAGMPFNLNSTQQLAHILFEKLGLPPGRKTKSGFSTDIAELERLAPIHELPAKILRYRHLAKLKSTYVDALPAQIHPITGRVHTSYSQAVAATGRLASNEPNLQNIPIRSEDGGRIRKAFIAGEEGWLILSADYSQIELRIMAHLSGDEKMIQAFKEGQDIHRSTAAWMHDMPPELVTPEIRRTAKEVNFGVLYGMGEFGLAQRLNITRKRAKEFIEQYFSNFPRVKGYINEIIEGCRKNGYVETIMGRRRPLPDITNKNFQARSLAERVATNTPIQGSAADIIKQAMIAVDKALITEGWQARMLMQVHDELVFEVPESEIEKFAERLKEVMSGVWPMRVPLEVGVAWGVNWGEAH